MRKQGVEGWMEGWLNKTGKQGKVEINSTPPLPNQAKNEKEGEGDEKNNQNPESNGALSIFRWRADGRTREGVGRYEMMYQACTAPCAHLLAARPLESQTGMVTVNRSENRSKPCVS